MEPAQLVSTCVIQGACFASLPLLSRFGVGAGLTCSLCCLPPCGEELDKQLLQPLFGYSPSGSTLSFVIGILEIPSAKTVVFPLLPLLGLYEAGRCLLQSSLPDTCCENDPILSCRDQPVTRALDPAVCSSREHYFEN